MTEKYDSFAPEKRRGILVLKKTDINNKKIKNEADFLLDDQIKVIDYPIISLPENASPKIVALLKEAVPGQLFLQSPYDADTYAKADLAQVQFSVDKYLLFSELCCLLGARELNVNEQRFDFKKRNSDIKAGVNHKLATAATEREQMHKNEFLSVISLNDKFAGGNANINSASQFLLDNNLQHDRQMTSLINLCKDSSNRILERNLMINLTSDVQSRMKLCGRVKSYGIELEAGYDLAIDEKLTIEVSVSVKF